MHQTVAGSCYTEPQYAASVQETLDVWYAGGMSSLKVLLP